MPDKTNLAAANGATGAGLLSLIRRRVLVYGGILFLLTVYQTTVCHVFPLFGMVPDLALFAVLGIAVFDGPTSGGAAGIAAGCFESVLGSAGVSVLPLLFFLIGYSAGVVAAKALSRTFVSWMVFSVALCGVRSVLTLAAISLDAGIAAYDLRAIFRMTLIPEFFCNLIAACPMYLVALLCARLTKGKGNPKTRPFRV